MDTEVESAADQLRGASPRRRVWTRKRILIGAGAVIVAATGVSLMAGAWATEPMTQAAINFGAVCFADDDMNSYHYESMLVDGQVPNAGAGRADNPIPGDRGATLPNAVAERIEVAIEQCAAGWRVDSPPTRDLPAPHWSAGQSPAFVGCEIPDGRVGVFPTDGRGQAELCADLGLPLPD